MVDARAFTISDCFAAPRYASLRRVPQVIRISDLLQPSRPSFASILCSDAMAQGTQGRGRGQGLIQPPQAPTGVSAPGAPPPQGPRPFRSQPVRRQTQPVMNPPPVATVVQFPAVNQGQQFQYQQQSPQHFQQPPPQQFAPAPVQQPPPQQFAPVPV